MSIFKALESIVEHFATEVGYAAAGLTKYAIYYLMVGLAVYLLAYLLVFGCKAVGWKDGVNYLKDFADYKMIFVGPLFAAIILGPICFIILMIFVLLK